MSYVDVLVLGGGPTGLGAAWWLAQHSTVEWMLCEGSDHLGGLSRSVIDDAGYTWDVGGHVCFSHYDLVSRMLVQAVGADGFFEHQREAWIRAALTWVPYPFQNNLHRLPRDVRDRCLRGLVAASEAAIRSAVAPKNFDEFIDATFGDGIAEVFMRPYNRRVWASPLDVMSYDWIADRVAVPDADRAARNVARGQDDVGWGPNSTFLFPKSGGTGAFWNGVGSLLPKERIRMRAVATSIDLARKTVEFEDGSSIAYGKLVTTIPLDTTAHMTGDRDLIELTSRLVHSSVNVMGLGVDSSVGASLGTKCWMYFAEDDTPFYRVTNFSHYSPANVPAGTDGASLLIEVSESPHRPVNQDTLVADVIAGLMSVGILDSAQQVSHVWTHRAEYGYPTPTLSRDDLVNRSLALLESHGILSRGRFGAWRYEVGNMDHSFAQGYEAAAHLLTGSAEVTVWNPSRVNSPHPTMGWDWLK